MLLTHCMCLIKVAQVFHVTEFTSSVNLSNRKFACENEEVVYRCVTVSTMENEFFYTEWTWINGSKQWQVGQFDSEQRIGNYTCRSYQKFLHSTLVSTNSTTCVSLLIVIPSLLQSHDRDINVIINCSAYGPDQQSLLHNQTLSHNYILSGECCMTVSYHAIIEMYISL